ncbi:MAG: SUMF1/EgtB/PvdO family nonheme iron enzyme [Chloroflexota bacterium]
MAGLVGQSVDRYHILEQLGEGGMAIVYKAYDTRLERDVAVKVIRTEKLTLDTMSKSLKRFEREAKSLGKLTHPNIVPITDYGEYEGKPYLVMPYLPGGTLKAKLGKPLPWNEAVELILPIAEALAYAHSQHTIHRDVKPSNIILTQSGRPMLTDFGIAKILDLEETQELTGTSAAMGTPEYMAPEQARAKSVDHRADIYALGIVLYEMATGRKPFIADTPMSVLIMQATEPLPPPRKFAPSLSERAERILIKALAKRPEDRYQTMEEMYAAVKGQVGAVEKAVKPAKPEPHSRPPVQTPVTEKNAKPKPEPRLLAQMPVTMDETPARVPTMIMQPPRAASNKSWLRWGAVVVLALICLLAGGNAIYQILPHGTPVVETQSPNIETSTTDGMTPVYIPAGEFSMGSTDGSDDEKPVHAVYLDGYWMDKTEVTNAMYKKCEDAGRCDPPAYSKSSTRESYYGNSRYDDYPVIYISWNNANAYCQWAGRRLPTEAEWEKAARGSDGRTYPWGNGDPSATLLNFSGNVGDTTEVGSYPSGASYYGLLDMAGNVWEWVADWFDADYYSSAPTSNPQGPSSGEQRVLRGGSWVGVGDLARSSFRLGDSPDVIYLNIGFRCARSE